MKSILKKLIPSFLFRFYHFLLAWLASVYYGFPSEKLVVVGVTGTNGKSTVVELASRILQEGGYKVSSISSIRFEHPGRRSPNTLKMTMPGRTALQQFLKEALAAGSTHAVIEVTSEGIKQFRHRFIHFDVGVFTNLTPEHIESHGSFEAYSRAKEQFFRKIASDRHKRINGRVVEKVFVINHDDAFSKALTSIKCDKLYTYSLKEPESGITIDFGSRWSLGNTSLSQEGVAFTLGGIGFGSHLLGEFNISNILAATAAGLSQGISPQQAQHAVSEVKGIPGRLEIIDSPQGFRVVVDYAHTPDALQKVYQTIIQHFRPKDLICVLGSAGGGRDKWKRKEMGEIAGKFCQKIFITNEDPYDEDPKAIIDEVADGVPKEKVEKILDRREAICTAVKSAQKGDVVICTGKGIEPWIMGPRGTKQAWNEVEVVKEELASLSRSHAAIG